MPLRDQRPFLWSPRGACDCSEEVLQVPRHAPQCSRYHEQAMPLREQHDSLLWSSRGACDCSEVVLQVPR